MTGKKKSHGWGGARAGAGKKKPTLSQSQVRKMIEHQDEYELKYGKSVYQLILDFIYDEDLGIRERISASKIWLDKISVPITESGETNREVDGPAVYLPQQRPDPVKLVK